MTKQTLTFNVRLTYDVYCKSPAIALKKAVEHLNENLPYINDKDDREENGLICTGLVIEQCHQVWSEE